MTFVNLSIDVQRSSLLKDDRGVVAKVGILSFYVTSVLIRYKMHGLPQFLGNRPDSKKYKALLANS